MAEAMKLGGGQGAVIANVTPMSSSAKAGFKAGDIITQFDKTDVLDMYHFLRLTAATPIGSEVDVTVIRNGERIDFHPVVEEVPVASKTIAVTPLVQSAVDSSESIGMTVSSITPPLREKLKLADDAKGVAVIDVRKDGAAAKRGIGIGDVIVEANQVEVNSPVDLAAQIDAARKVGRKSTLLLVRRGNQLLFVPVVFAASGE
jgi:serine protease Do